jgi:hypothetical protein
MATVDIFGSIDVDGIIETYKARLTQHYGEDPTVETPGPSLRRKIIDYAKSNLLAVGGGDSPETPELRKYVRLVSSKRSTLGYEIKEQDITTDPATGKKYLTYTYNLSIGANNGDKLRWWGHTINPNSKLQSVISGITIVGQSAPPPQFTNLKPSNTNFLYASSAENIRDLSDGLNVETNNTFCLTAILQGQVGNSVSYNIQILVLSANIENDDGKRMTYPILKIVVDPTVIIRA